MPIPACKIILALDIKTPTAISTFTAIFFIARSALFKVLKWAPLSPQDLIIFIEDCYIELRDRLGLAPQVTFGLELELEHTKKDEIYKQLHKVFPNGEWIVKPDSSLNNGIEINSPVLTDKTATWTSLDQVCSIVEPLGFIAANSGGHIHIGTQVLGDKKEAWLNFIKLWSVYENIIFAIICK